MRYFQQTEKLTKKLRFPLSSSVIQPMLSIFYETSSSYKPFPFTKISVERKSVCLRTYPGFLHYAFGIVGQLSGAPVQNWVGDAGFLNVFAVPFCVLKHQERFNPPSWKSVCDENGRQLLFRTGES